MQVLNPCNLPKTATSHEALCATTAKACQGDFAKPSLMHLETKSSKPTICHEEIGVSWTWNQARVTLFVVILLAKNDIRQLEYEIW